MSGTFISPVCYSCMHMKLELIKPRAKAFNPANKHTQTVKKQTNKDYRHLLVLHRSTVLFSR